MEGRKIRTKDLKLARVKYFDWERNGAELTDIEAYAFLERVGNRYVNVFDYDEELPVYDRTIYPNVMRNGEEYGNLLLCLSGQIESGPCYVIEPVDVKKLLDTDTISMEALKEYIYHSAKFFVDRIHLIEREKPSKRFIMMRMLKSDQKKMEILKGYISSHENTKQYVK